MARYEKGKRMKYGFCAATCIVGLLLPLSGCMKDSGATDHSKKAMAPVGQANRGESATARSNSPDPANAVSVDVVIDNFTFDPPKLTISAGTKVTWINHDD